MSFFKQSLSKIVDSGKSFRKTSNITIAGLLIALYIVISYFNIAITESLQIRFGFLVLAAAGLSGGPIMGLLVGVLGDILSTLIKGGSSGFFFGFTFSYGLLGFLYGIIFYKAKITTIRAVFGGIVEFLNAMFLNTLWLCIMFGSAFFPMFLSRLPKNLIMLVINIILLFVILNPLANALRKSKIIE